MEKDFFERLEKYFIALGEALRGNAKAASVLLNTSDVGFIREKLLKAFLENHLPSSCNVILGGFLFNMEGKESKQLDIIVTTDISSQFKHFGEKCFACVDGTLAVISVKSNLTKKELSDALLNIASIPAANKLFDPNTDGQKALKNLGLPYPTTEGWVDENLWLLAGKAPNYRNWPYKVIFASGGPAKGETLAKWLDLFYEEHPEVPYEKRPDLIWVSGRYEFCKTPQKDDGSEVDYVGSGCKPDLFAPLRMIGKIQDIYAASRFIKFNFMSIGNSL